jgi:NADPH:quinone reductase-like Zn-dependent oxidoreductase
MQAGAVREGASPPDRGAEEATGARSCGSPPGHAARVIGSSRTAAFFLAKPNGPDLVVLRDLIESGQVTPVVDRTFGLADVARAFDHLATGHARGKVVIIVA